MPHVFREEKLLLVNNKTNKNIVNDAVFTNLVFGETEYFYVKNLMVFPLGKLSTQNDQRKCNTSSRFTQVKETHICIKYLRDLGTVNILLNEINTHLKVCT